jgi:hypothetical protein
MKAFRIPEPCNVDWRTMTPAEGGRFCGDCKKVVKNLSRLTEREAKKLLREENNGSLCVRYAYDKHGKILFGADAPRETPPIPAASLLRRAGAAASLALAAACSSDPDPQPLPPASTEALKADHDDHQSTPPSDDSTDNSNESWNMGGAPAPDSIDTSSEDAGPASTDAGAPIK